MPSIASLSKKLIPSKLRNASAHPDSPDAQIDDASTENIDDVEFDVPSATASPTHEMSQEGLGMDEVASDEEKAHIAELIAEYGSSSNTSWLEFSRYKIWTADRDIAPSSFRPVQGYMRSDPFVFAWGNPLVSDPAALEQTCLAFWKWCKERKLKLVWCCVDEQMEKVLGKGSKFNWATVSCIVEDTLDPKSVVDIANGQANGSSEVKDLKKNIRRAEREGVEVREIKWDDWTHEQKKEIETNIAAWKAAKSGIQLASTSFQPWIDEEHRRYFIAEAEGKIVGILILSAIGGGHYQIKNAVSFPGAPRGTSEFLVYQIMTQLDGEEEDATVWDQGDVDSDHDSASSARSSSRVSDTSSDSSDRPGRVSVTFGISASEEIEPINNIGGWRVSWLTKTYSKVVGATGITKRGDYRSKFGAEHVPMYVCYPAKQGFGLEGVRKLMQVLRQ